MAEDTSIPRISIDFDTIETRINGYKTALTTWLAIAHAYKGNASVIASNAQINDFLTNVASAVSDMQTTMQGFGS